MEHTAHSNTHACRGVLGGPDLWVVTVHVKLHKLCYCVLPDTV